MREYEIKNIDVTYDSVISRYWRLSIGDMFVENVSIKVKTHETKKKENKTKKEKIKPIPTVSSMLQYHNRYNNMDRIPSNQRQILKHGLHARVRQYWNMDYIKSPLPGCEKSAPSAPDNELI